MGGVGPAWPRSARTEVRPTRGLCLKGRGGIGAVPERLQSGHRGCESGWGAVSGGWTCGWGWCWGMGMPFGYRVRAVGGGVPPPSSDSLPYPLPPPAARSFLNAPPSTRRKAELLHVGTGDGHSAKAQKEIWLVSGPKDRRCVSVTRVRPGDASAQATNTQSNGSQRNAKDHREAATIRPVLPTSDGVRILWGTATPPPLHPPLNGWTTKPPSPPTSRGFHPKKAP